MFSCVLYRRRLTHWNSLLNGMSKRYKKHARKTEEPNAVSPKSDVVGPVFSSSDLTVTIRVLAKPGSRQNVVSDISEEYVGIQIAAPPVDGEANSELIKYVSKTLGIRKSDVILEKGSKSRTKTLKVSGIDAETVLDRLKAIVQT